MKYLTTLLLASVCLLTAVKAQESAADTIAIHSRSSWGAKEAKPYKQQQIERITIHHEGGRILLATDDAAQRLRNIQTWCMGPDRNWADIPYHFLIAPDGTVYEGRDVFTVGETNTEYNPEGHLHVSFLGNYTQQKLDENLLEVLTSLLKDLCVKYNISPEQIATHRDHSSQTTCPGEDIYSYFKSGYIKEEVTRKLQRLTPR